LPRPIIGDYYYDASAAWFSEFTKVFGGLVDTVSDMRPVGAKILQFLGERRIFYEPGKIIADPFGDQFFICSEAFDHARIETEGHERDFIVGFETLQRP